MPIDPNQVQWDETPQINPEQVQWETEKLSAPQQAEEIGNELMRQVGLTVRHGAEGVAGVIGILSDPITMIMNSALPEQYKIKFAREGVSQILTDLGVPEPKNKAERIVAAITQGGVGAMTGAGLASTAAKATTGTTQAVMQALAAQPVQQLAGGMGSGAAQQTVAEEGGGAVAQTGAALAGGILGAGAIGTKATPRPIPAGLAEAEKRGVRVLTTDVIPPESAMAKSAQSVSEKTILGTGKSRALQQQERKAAIVKTLEDYGVETQTPTGAQAPVADKVTEDLIKRRSGLLTRMTGMKKDVINRLDNKGAVPVDKTMATIDDEITRLKDISETGYAPAIKFLEEFKTDIAGKTMTNIEGNRKLLGKRFVAPELTAVRDEGEKSVAKIYQSLREDMGDFIKQNGDPKDFNKWKVANKKLSAMADEIDEGKLKSLLKTGEDTPENIKGMLFSRKPSEVRRVYNQLTPRGKSYARTAVLQEVAAKAGGIEQISPEKFKTAVQKMGESIGVVFKGEDLRELEGLQRALNLTRRGGEAGVMTPTGMQTLPFVGGAVLADIFGSYGAALVSGGTIGVGARVLESAPVRNLLLKIPKYSKGSPEEAAAVKRLMNVFQQEYEKQKLKEEPAQ